MGLKMSHIMNYIIFTSTEQGLNIMKLQNYSIKFLLLVAFIEEAKTENAPMETAPTQSEKAPSTDVADEIKKYKELLDSGAITQEECEQKKKQLLGL